MPCAFPRRFLLHVPGVGHRVEDILAGPLETQSEADFGVRVLRGGQEAVLLVLAAGHLEGGHEVQGQIAAGGESYGGTGVTVIPENKSSEAAAALAVLGYSTAEIGVALKGIDLDALSLEEIIKQALKKMVKG